MYCEIIQSASENGNCLARCFALYLNFFSSSSSAPSCLAIDASRLNFYSSREGESENKKEKKGKINLFNSLVK